MECGNSHDGSNPDCGPCRSVLELNEMLQELWPQPPRYRYWSHGNREYQYTTERADEGKYWALEYRHIKSKKVWKLIRKVGFRQRKKAKQRAYDWYSKAANLQTA